MSTAAGREKSDNYYHNLIKQLFSANVIETTLYVTLELVVFKWLTVSQKATKEIL